MALIWIDGFETYSVTVGTDITTLLQDRYLSTAGTSTLQSPRIAGTNYSCRIQGLTTKDFGNISTWIVGFGLQFPSSTSGRFFDFEDSGTVQCSINLNGSGNLEFRRGTATILATGTATISTGTWYHIEAKVTVDNTSGAAEIKVNGTTDINVSSVDTTTTANDYANRLSIVNAANNKDFDDFYICDTTGSLNNDFLGDKVVELLKPAGAGTNTDWTPLSGSNYQNVDEIPADSDTTYVSSSTNGDKDTYDFDNLSVIKSNVRGLQISLVAKNVTSGAEIAPLVRSGGTDYTGTKSSLTSSYGTVLQIYETDPDTSSQWNKANVNSAEFGQTIEIEESILAIAGSPIASNPIGG